MDWKQTLATVAPAIATALGGPLAGVAVSMAGKAIGLGDGATESDVEAAVLTGNPDVLVRLREVNTQFERDMKALDIDLERIHAGDRLSARDLAKSKGTLVQTALTVLFCSVFAVLIGQIFTGQEVVHSSMRDIANFLLGTLTGILMQQMNFWFGSSSGSKEKTQKLDSLK
jgi:hypothetical protein